MWGRGRGRGRGEGLGLGGRVVGFLIWGMGICRNR